MQIRLSWDEPATGERREPTLNLPVAIGREFAQLPTEISGKRVSRLVFNSQQISRYHVLIDLEQGQLVVTDQNSSNGTFVNGQPQKRCIIQNGDSVQIGPYYINLSLVTAASQATRLPSSGDSQIFFNPQTNLPDPRFNQAPPPVATPVARNFPPPAFQSQFVDINAVYATGYPVDEVDYGALGGGLGSYIWANLLRISGVKSHQIMALGLEDKPYARYKLLCQNSQIPLHERLRSNSDSCPDNFWGWPSYALRESLSDLGRGRLLPALKYLWQVFSEPTFAETYTPRSGRVFDSIDREAARIGWSQIFRYGRIRGIRKTNDGRYVVAYSRQGGGNYAFLIARHIHLALGYPAIQFLPDLQDYREKNQDFKAVVNAYEQHDHVYEHLERFGGTLLMRGRGIVASRIVQRIFEARQRNQNINLVHLMRSPKPQGNKYGSAQRRVKDHYEFQPFNWPKACWGGDLRQVLEQADPETKKRLFADWGGTTTADRGDWERIVATGLREGWYQIAFGEVERVEPGSQGGTVTYIQERGMKGKLTLQADFIVDATGLDAKAKSSQLLDDLVTHYNLPLNHLGRLSVSNDFELVEMRNQQGKMYAAGAATLGGPYAPVDSFLGLQYAVLRCVDHLAKSRSPGLHRLNAITSLGQWCKWVFNQSPS